MASHDTDFAAEHATRCAMLFDGMLAAECIDREPTYWSGDGVHPNENGARLIGGWYADAFDKVLRK